MNYSWVINIYVILANYSDVFHASRQIEMGLTLLTLLILIVKPLKLFKDSCEIKVDYQINFVNFVNFINLHFTK